MASNVEISAMANRAGESVPSPAVRAITIAIVAMGGEGGGVLADWIVSLAEHGGYSAQTTSVPGVAQRTGATIYYVEMFPEAALRAAGKEPVLALIPVPGELDIVLASELMEAGRAIQRGLVTSDRTTFIASTNRVYSMTEKIALEDGRVDSAKLIEAGEKAAKRFVHGDFASIASATGSVISAALFGALAATQALPFTRSQFEDAIRRGGVGVESSLAAFAAGLAAASGSSSSATQTAATSAVRSQVGPKLQAEVQRIEREFPAAAHEFMLSGVQRLADYQDRAYAAEYLNLLQGVRDADIQYGDGTFAVLRETARYLALWMTYEDAVRVADLKIRRARFQRVQKDSRAAANQLVQIHEFLHPGVEEITDILPAWLGRRILRSKWLSVRIEKSTKRGMIVQTTSLRGFLQLYVLANLRRWRHKSLRFGEEHRRIAEWLALLPTMARENYALALEVAEYPNVIKGYGETHQRGRKSFDAMLAVLPKLRGKSDSAARVKKLREASVADDTGTKLAEALQEVTR